MKYSFQIKTLPKVIGHYRALLGYPDLYGNVKVYRCRWHDRLGFQVKIHFIDSLRWINIPFSSFQRI